MTRSFVRMLVAACVGGLALMAVPAFGQSPPQVTITGTGCTQWVLSGTPPNQILTCTSGAPPTPVPVCTVQGATTGVVGIPTTLTARCAPEAGSFLWAGGSCAGQTGATCNATSGAVGGVTYTVRGTNGTGQGPVSPNFVVAWTAAPPATPTGCSVTRSPANGQLASAGGAISVTGSCTGGGTPTTWTWQKNGVGWGTTLAAQNDTLAANTLTTAVTYSYTLTACNGASCAAPTIATFTVAAAAGGGGGGGGPITCTGTGISSTITLDIPWSAIHGANSGIIKSGTPPGGMTPGTVVVARFTVPAGAAPYPGAGVGHVNIYEYFDTLADRWTTLSTTACAWGTPGDGWTIFAKYPTFFFTITGSVGGAVTLQPGTTYYLNIRHNDPATLVNTCYAGSCNVGVELTQPPGD